jgi:hypothetical protein
METQYPKFSRFRQWVDIGERSRHYPPLLWITYPESPLTVSEAYDKAIANRILLMHRHETDRVIAQMWVPSSKSLQEKY